jgi:putative toxin-antitoxin system antitoxin component (TIGR02293 family)
MNAIQEAARSSTRTAFDRAVDLLGGSKLLKHPVESPMDAHDMILRGIPSEALAHLLSNLDRLRMAPSMERAVGMSLRTFQRRKEAPSRPLSQEQSGKAWKFAEILAAAIEVMGSQEVAERWLETPAMALDGKRPIELLATPAGTEMVEDLLGRIQYGVYT